MKRKILESYFVRFVRYVIDWRKTRAVIRELNALTDKELKDIGIQRYEINNLIYRLEEDDKDEK